MIRLAMATLTTICLGATISCASAPLDQGRIEVKISRTSTFKISMPALLAEQASIAPVAAKTAIYDILAHVVTLPDGTRLEAHSGLGARVDDPHFVHLRMRGATPPALYALKPRERLFHGVAALRLMPLVGNIFRRTGLLAHTYMLRGQPASNGCVVFRDYPAFLRAYLEGKIQRLLVVPSAADTLLPVR